MSAAGPRAKYARPRLVFDDAGNIIEVQRWPYTPAAWEELDDDRLSGDALRLLLLMRRYSDERGTDGVVAENVVRALAIEHNIGRKRLKSALDLLVRCEHVLRVLGAQGIALRDAHFAHVCFTAHERRERKEQWKRRQHAHRDAMSRRDDD